MPQGRQQAAAEQGVAMPVQQRAVQAFLHGHIHHLAVVSSAGDGGQHQQWVGCLGEATVAFGCPGHGGAIGITVPQAGVVPHAQLIAVVDAGHPRQAVKQRVQSFVRARIAVQQRGEPAVDAPIEPMSLGIGKTFADAIDDLLRHQVAIAQPEFVVIAQGQRPAAAGAQLAKLSQEVMQRADLPARHRSEQVGR